MVSWIIFSLRKIDFEMHQVGSFYLNYVAIEKSNYCVKKHQTN